jgi:hypothetical protein
MAAAAREEILQVTNHLQNLTETVRHRKNLTAMAAREETLQVANHLQNRMETAHHRKNQITTNKKLIIRII